MSDEKETYAGPVEQEIRTMMEAAGNEIMDFTHEPASINVNETVQNIRIANLNKYIIYLAKEIDKLAKAIK